MSQLRIFIADTCKDSRLALLMLLDHEPGMKVVGLAVQSDGLAEQVAAASPQVVLLDWQMIRHHPSQLIGSVRARAGPCPIVVLDVRPETEGAAMAAGADVFFTKNAPPDDLPVILRNTIRIDREETIGEIEDTSARSIRQYGDH